MPGFDAKLPLAISPVDGAYWLNSDLREVIKQEIKMLLLTEPGERVMDMRYGVGFKRMLFENKTADLKSYILTRLSDQTAKYMPQIRVSEFEYLTSEDDEEISDHAVRLFIRFYVPSLNVSDSIEFETFIGVR